jgi:hypothetical protein
MNRQTRTLSKLGLCTRNLGPNTEVFKVNPSSKTGRPAGMSPDRAKIWLKEHGIRSWKTNGRHPNNVPIGSR